MKAHEFFNRDDWVEDLQELVTIDTSSSNVHVIETLSTPMLGVTSNAVIVSLDAGTVDVETQLTACNIRGITIDARSNLCWGGHSLREPFPGDPSDWDDLIPFQGDNEGMIHHSWLLKPLTAKDVLTDLWNLAENGVQVAETLKDIYDFFNPQEDVIPQAMLDALQTALEAGGDDATSSNNVYVSYSNLKSKPIANSGLNIGLKGDIYLAESATLKSIPDMHLQKLGRDNLTIVSTSNAQEVLRIGTREMFPSVICIGQDTSNCYIDETSLRIGGSNSTDCNALVLTQNDIRFGCNSALQINSSNTDFQIHKWKFGSNNLQIGSSNSTLVLNNGLSTKLNVTCRAVATDQLIGSAGYVWFRSSNLVSAYYGDLVNTYLQQSEKSLRWVTHLSPSCNDNIIYAQVPQFSVDDAGTLYVASNIYQNSPFLARAVRSATIDELPAEGHLMFTPDVLRHIKREYTDSENFTDSVHFSVNSNGLFLTRRTSIFGAIEYFQAIDANFNYYWTSNFSRLDSSLERGLVWGNGIFGPSSNLANRDYFRVTRDGELSTYAKDVDQMATWCDSNANIGHCNLRIWKDGTLRTGSSVIIQGGSIYRRSNLEDPAGFFVSPSGYLTQGALQFWPSGDLNHAGRRIYDVATSTIACSNLVVSNNITEAGQMLSDRYLMLSGGNVTSHISLSNQAYLEFGKHVVGKELNAGRIGYQTFTQGALDIVGAGGSLGTRNIQLWDNVNTYGTLSEGGVLLSEKYALCNALSNYMLTAQPHTYTTFKSVYGPSGLQHGLVVDNENVNYGSGSAVTLSTSSNWRCQISQQCAGDGNHFMLDMTSGGSTSYSNAIDISNLGGNIRVKAQNLVISDLGYGSNTICLQHAYLPEYLGRSYALTQTGQGQTALNCAASNSVEIRANDEPIARFTQTSWGIGASIDGTFLRLGQGCGAFVKTGRWKLAVLQQGAQYYNATIPLYGQDGIFPNSNYQDHGWTGDMVVYFSSGYNGTETAIARLYITNTYQNSPNVLVKDVDNRGCVVAFPGNAQFSSTILLQVNELMSYCWKFEGAV